MSFIDIPSSFWAILPTQPAYIMLCVGEGSIQMPVRLQRPITSNARKTTIHVCTIINKEKRAVALRIFIPKLQLFYEFTNTYFTADGSHLKAAAAHELPANGVSGKEGAVHTYEVIKELEKSLGFIVLGFVLADVEKKRLCILLDNCKLVDLGGIEHLIGLLLEGEDVCFLAGSYRAPHADGPLG